MYSCITLNEIQIRADDRDFWQYIPEYRIPVGINADFVNKDSNWELKNPPGKEHIPALRGLSQRTAEQYCFMLLVADWRFWPTALLTSESGMAYIRLDAKNQQTNSIKLRFGESS